MKGLYRRNGNGWFLSSAQLLFPVPAAIIEIERLAGCGNAGQSKRARHRKVQEEREHEPETDRTNSK